MWFSYLLNACSSSECTCPIKLRLVMSNLPRHLQSVNDRKRRIDQFLLSFWSYLVVLFLFSFPRRSVVIILNKKCFIIYLLCRSSILFALVVPGTMVFYFIPCRYVMY